ncbi:MAG: glycosyltransferase family 4 protein [Bacteroidia bacterium]|nr:glycosyltransferase family 4 protein [Bacteroidia bacterium]MDW8417088.1 glycosyltransferase family 4 protein [Bacteroidia bacterium]
MKIALLTVYPPNRVPGTRYRIEPYLPILRGAGFEVEWKGFFASESYEQFLSPSVSMWRKAVIFSGRFFKSLLEAVFRGRIDGVYLYREATLLGLPLIEYLWMRGLPVLMDFDDAIWMADTSEQFKSFSWLKSQNKTARLLRHARVVTVCNEYLASYAREHAQEVRIIPTTVDTDVYQPVGHRASSPIVIGWSGSATTLAHLRTIEDALSQLYAKYTTRIHFLFIGAPAYRPPFPAEVLPWSPQTEVQLLQRMHIGLMPLPDTEWSLGKCALKALLYMAVGIPAVVSPVGMNTSVVHDGINGLWAKGRAEWIEKLSLLIESAELRDRLGYAARHTVETVYSVKANAEKYIAAFHTAFCK